MPYIGITGFMSRDEVEVLEWLIPKDNPRRLMVGVLVSDNTLRGESNKWPNRYPPPASWRTIFPEDGTVNIVHFHTHTRHTLATDLVILMQKAGTHCHGVQLNVAWPELSLLRWYRETYPDKILVLQYSAAAREAVGGNLLEATKRVLAAAPFITHVVYEMSGGQGPFLYGDDLNAAYEFFQAVGLLPERIQPVIAGGLTAENLVALKPLVREFPNLSIDAEGGLRDELDQLDLDKAQHYLEAALELFA